MKEWNIDVAVLCIFFVRPEQFEKTFEQVRKARPKTLLLWQDGPRENSPDDMENIMKCRKIADNIDWNCRVHKSFHSNNFGCDPSTFYSHKWAFSIVSKCIVLEDDVVASQSFFYFCKELLDRYEYDERVDRICGQTLYDGIDDNRYSYFFSSVGSSWGWASWRRVAQTWEENYDVLDDDYYLDLLNHKNESSVIHKRMIKEAKQHKVEKIPHWEHILGISTALNSRLVIFPTDNLVENIGASDNATHATDHIEKLPADIRTFFETKSKEIEFPLNHPHYMVDDYHYKKKIMNAIQPGFFRKLKRKLERVWLMLLRG
jgi:hypothetical protein